MDEILSFQLIIPCQVLGHELRIWTLTKRFTLLMLLLGSRWSAKLWFSAPTGQLIVCSIYVRVVRWKNEQMCFAIWFITLYSSSQSRNIRIRLTETFQYCIFNTLKRNPPVQLYIAKNIIRIATSFRSLCLVRLTTSFQSCLCQSPQWVMSLWRDSTVILMFNLNGWSNTVVLYVCLLNNIEHRIVLVAKQ